MNCQHCGAETSNGLALRQKCRETFSTACVNTAAYFTDVDRIRPGQGVKVKSTYRSAPPPSTQPATDKIANALDEVATAVFGWCRALADDRCIESFPTLTERRCGWLESHTASIATLPWAGDVVTDMLKNERTLRNILDNADTGETAGICGNEIGREVDEYGDVITLYCPRHLYMPPGRSYVTCPECGRAWDGIERRERMQAQAHEELLPIRLLAHAVVALTDEPSPEKLIRRIEKWVDRQQLEDYGVRVLDGRPRRVYRIGDVLKLVNGEVLPKDAKVC